MGSRVEPIGVGHAAAAKDIEQLQLSSINWIELIKHDTEPEFLVFKLNSGRAYYSVVLVQVLLCLLKIILVVRAPGSPAYLRFTMMGSMLVPVCGWTYTYLYKSYSYSDVLGWQGRRIVILGNTCIILQSFFSGLSVLLWALNRDSCNHSTCLPGYPEEIIPYGAVMQLVTGAVAMPMFYMSHDALAAVVSFTISFSMLLASALVLDVHNKDIASTLMAWTMLFISLAIYEGNVYTNFTLYSKFESSLRQRLESENKEYIMKLQTEEMRHMIGNVAHDLRTPLHAFQSELEVLRDNSQGGMTKETLEQFQSIEQLDRIINFMTMTINRSIDFTKASSGLKLKHSIESVNFLATLEWAVGCMVIKTEVKSEKYVPIVIAPVPPDIHTHVYTDKQWLMENVLCLLSNAKKFTTEGEITVRCSLQTISSPDDAAVLTSDLVDSAAAIDSQVDEIIDLEAPRPVAFARLDSEIDDLKDVQMIRVEVEDTGIGISEENRARLFRPFSQAQQHSGGTGLGLYALSKRMESLGGQCGVEARADGASGSCFWISIPYRPDESEVGAEAVVSHSFVNPVYTRLRSCRSVNSRDSTDEKEDSSVSITPQKLSTLRVLLVDDSALIRKATSRFLINDGHQIDIAQHGAEALKVLEESRVGSQTGDFGFDLVLMDLHMPVMDGLEATSRIRQLEAAMVSENPDGGGSRIMIIGLSANTEGEVKAECLESGMDGFLEKPLKMNKFKKYVAKLINDSIQGSV